MNGRIFTIGMSRNPIVQVISVVLVGLAVIVAIFMGAVILAFVFGLAMVGAIVLAVRIWWARRKLRSAKPAAGGTIIDAEYTVVKERELRGPDNRRG